MRVTDEWITETEDCLSELELDKRDEAMQIYRRVFDRVRQSQFFRMESRTRYIKAGKLAELVIGINDRDWPMEFQARGDSVAQELHFYHKILTSDARVLGPDPDPVVTEHILRGYLKEFLNGRFDDEATNEHGLALGRVAADTFKNLRSHLAYEQEGQIRHNVGWPGRGRNDYLVRSFENTYGALGGSAIKMNCQDSVRLDIAIAWPDCRMTDLPESATNPGCARVEFSFWDLIQGAYKVQRGDIIVFADSAHHIVIAMKQGMVKSHWIHQVGAAHAILSLDRLLEQQESNFSKPSKDRMLLLREMRFLRQVPISF